MITEEQIEAIEWRELYESRKRDVLLDTRYFEQYAGIWNYRLSFHASPSHVERAIPAGGALYRCSYWYSSYIHTKFMGSVVVPALSQNDAYYTGSDIATLTESPLMSLMAVKDIDPLRLSREADEMGHAFLGSVVLHIPMDQDPCGYADRALEVLRKRDKGIYYKIQSLGLFIERHCRNSFGPRYTALRALRELEMYEFKLKPYRFSVDMYIHDRDFREWINWPDPGQSFQERYMMQNEFMTTFAESIEFERSSVFSLGMEVAA